MRTDVHRPSEIQPEQYDFIDCVYLGGSDLGAVLMNKEARENVRRHMERTGGRYSNHEHGGTCFICGATALYLAVFRHPETNTYIQCGEECAAKLGMGDKDAFNPLRRAIKDAREAKAGKLKAQTVLADAGIPEAWGVYTEGSDYREASTIKDVVDRLVKYGHISDKQVGLLRSLCDSIEQRKRNGGKTDREIEFDRQREAAEDCPAGRVEICGEVVKCEVKEGAYGDRVVWTIRDDRGFLVWGNVPAACQLFDVVEPCEFESFADYLAAAFGETDETKFDSLVIKVAREHYEELRIGLKVQRGPRRGDRVSFTATVTPSDRDTKFGFYKRPAKATISPKGIA